MSPQYGPSAIAKISGDIVRWNERSNERGSQVISLIIGIVVSLAVTVIGTPLLINLVHRLHYGQYIRQDGPKSHLVKRGTPTMGGVIINLAIVLGWVASATYRFIFYHTAPSWSAILVLFAMVSMGFLGFIDDFAKVRKKQNLGLSVRAKFLGQFIFATIYAVLSLIVPTKSGYPSAQAGMAFIEKPFFSFDFAGRFVAIIIFVVWVNFLMAAWTNAVNLNDGLDGLASGSSMIAFVGYAIIAFWESYHIKGGAHLGFTYAVSDPLDLSIIAVCAATACFGFLWYNTKPATIFMGDTGSLALGGLFAALSISTHTEFLAIIMGGLFVIEAMSDVIQVGYFKMTHKRVFKMAPIHHHFELMGWPESKVVVRFWMVEFMFVLIGMVVFYGDWVARSGLVG